jgi:hypothetical protein
MDNITALTKLHVLWITASIGPFDIIKLFFGRFYFLCWLYIKYPQISTNATIVSVLGLAKLCRQIASRKMTRVSILFKFCFIFIQNDYWKFRLIRGHAFLWVGAFHTHVMLQLGDFHSWQRTLVNTCRLKHLQNS